MKYEDNFQQLLFAVIRRQIVNVEVRKRNEKAKNLSSEILIAYDYMKGRLGL